MELSRENFEWGRERGVCLRSVDESSRCFRIDDGIFRVCTLDKGEKMGEILSYPIERGIVRPCRVKRILSCIPIRRKLITNQDSSSRLTMRHDYSRRDSLPIHPFKKAQGCCFHPAQTHPLHQDTRTTPLLATLLNTHS